MHHLFIAGWLGPENQDSIIGFGTVVATILLSIVRQEIAARKTTKQIETKTTQVAQEVKDAVSQQAEVTEAGRTEIKNVIKSSSVAAAVAAKRAQYETAEQWQQYIETRINEFIAAVQHLEEMGRKMESTLPVIQRSEIVAYDLGQQIESLSHQISANQELIRMLVKQQTQSQNPLSRRS